MNEKDPLEELFRVKAEEDLVKEKPREIVWKKIESNLKETNNKPMKDFIGSIWSSAAVFTLIAVPYFYFLIENMNQKETTLDTISKMVRNKIETDQNKAASGEQETIKIEQTEEMDIVKNDLPVESNSSRINSVQLPIEKVTDEDEIMPTSVEIASEQSFGDNKDTILLANSVMYKINTPDSVEENSDETILLSANSNMKKKESPSPSLASINKDKSSDILIFHRNRFVVQDQVNRINFQFIKNSNNRLVFNKDGIKITLMRDKGLVKLWTNSKKIKPEILSKLIANKENIYNYYINFPTPNSQIIGN